ncbi:MAG: hypothetical protein R6V19_09075 [Armatimonadota bacterium]
MNILRLLTIAVLAFAACGASGQVPVNHSLEQAAQMLDCSSRELAKISRLQLPEDVHCDIQGASSYKSPRALDSPGDLLFDGKTTDQGIFAAPQETLTINLNLVARRKITYLQVLYSGRWDEPGVPEIPIFAVSTQGDTVQVGLLPALVDEPEKMPVVQQAKWLEDTGRAGHEWTRLRLVIPSLPPELGVAEIRMEAYDAALRRIATASHTLAKQPEQITAGIISQLAIALRVRRAREQKKRRIERIVSEYSALVSDLSGVQMILETAPADDEDEAGELTITLQNTSEQPLLSAAIRLQLPPGCRAAPARLQVEEVAPGETVCLPVKLWLTDPGQSPGAYLVGAWDDQPFFLIARSGGADKAASEQ